jgi:hypothetical protein
VGSVLGLGNSISQSPISDAVSSPGSGGYLCTLSSLHVAQRQAEGLAAEVLQLIYSIFAFILP